MSYSLRTPLQRATSLICVLLLAAAPLQAAVAVRPSIGLNAGASGGKVSVPVSNIKAVAPGTNGSLAPLQTSMNGTLPSLDLPASGVSGAAEASVQSTPREIEAKVIPASSGRSLKNSLKTAISALGQDQKAGKKRPGLASLGSKVSAPSAETSLGEQSAAADTYFRQKAGFTHNELPQSEDFIFDAFAPESVAPQRTQSVLEDVADPRYPSRRIRFNGTSLPSVAMRPDRPVETEIVKAIDASKKTIDIALYEFKNREILKALRNAKERGVTVRVIIDAGHANPAKREGSDYWPHRSMELQSLILAGFEVRVLKGAWRWGIMHNKVAVFDDKLGLFGSYNWSYTSERNHYENVVFTTTGNRVKAINELWKYLNANSVDFADSLKHQWPENVPAPPKDKSLSVRFNGLRLPAYVFTPDLEAEDWIVRVLEKAQKSVDMSMFTYTSPRISQALLAAKKRGVKVRVLLDQSQSGQSFMQPFVEWLAFHGVETKTLAGPNPDGPVWAEKNHNKFTIVDGKLVLTGSLNYTKSGFITNYENMFLLDDKSDAKAYTMFFDDMFGSRRTARVVPPAKEPVLPTEKDIVDGLRGPPEALPAAPTFPDLPKTGEVTFNRKKFPASVVRPHHPVKDLLVQALDSSQKSIHLALYEFDIPEILEALRRAKKRGVKVHVIFDYSRFFPKGTNTRGEPKHRSGEMQALLDEGFDVSVLRGVKAQGIMHNKIGIFDGKMTTFGSYNWSRTAEQFHFESVKFETEKARVDFYRRYWDWMRSYAVHPDKAEAHKWNQAWKQGQKEGRTTPVDEDPAIELNGERFPRSAVSPQGLAEDTIIRAIRAAHKTIDIAMFSFYSARIAEELLRAKERGVHVRIAFDRMQSKLMKLDNWFAYYGFDVKIVPGPNPYGIVYFEKNHNKFMLVDGKMLQMGSFNYTGNAEENSYENLNFYNDPLELAFYAAYFQLLYNYGWAPMMPEAPPEGLPTPAEFFDPQRLAQLQAAAGDEL
ncbi:MAG: phospholipase D-like domain-containing protein [Elusimicrobiota bacterium]